MGMYTKLNANLIIDNDRCIDIIKYMLKETDKIPSLPEHDLFKTDRWEFMLKSCSYYFTGTNNSKLIYDEQLKRFILHCDCDLKNYDNEIELFLEWISSFIENKGYKNFLGYIRYEECTYPTLIFIEDGKIICENLDKGE